MILIIDNTKDLENSYMTPKLIRILEALDENYQIVATNSELSLVDEEKVIGVILSGGPICLSQPVNIGEVSVNLNIISRFYGKKPILGICFGFQILTVNFGGSIVALDQASIGQQTVYLKESSPLFKGLDNTMLEVVQHHKDIVGEIPDRFTVIAYGEVDNGISVQAVEDLSNRIWGVQFHPEALESTAIIIKNFIRHCK